MNTLRHFLFLPVLLAYLAIFLAQEKLFTDSVTELRPVPSAQFLRATAGYLRQLTAEIIFTQSAVFLGGVKPGTDPQSYGPVLAHNYRQTTLLYPEFKDPYFFAQGYLPYISHNLAASTNEILETARSAHPDDFTFILFQGVNLFRHMDAPLEASALFKQASFLPGAPPYYERLAVILAAEGGMMEASILSLMALWKNTDDMALKQRYQEEMDIFKAALAVQKAANAFQVERLRYPATLDELVPDYLPALPNFGRAFELTWKPPVVGLKRPMPGR